MHKLIQITIIPLLVTQLASAQERQIKLLNPDFTPATDAKVVAVLLTPGGVVDQDLKPRQTPNDRKEPLVELVNDNGTVTVVDAKTIVASNEQGFLFLPASAFAKAARLQEWAHVELDVSTVPEDKRDGLRLTVMWTNSIQGTFVRPETPRNADEFSTEPAISKEPQPDWRFDPMIVWTHAVPVATQSLRVPPGEILISLASKQLSEESEVFAEMPPGSIATNIGLWRVPSGTTQKIALPEFGSVEGTISDQSMLPDWSKSGRETTRILLNPESLLGLPVILQPSGSRDDYFSKLTSNEGFRTRQSMAHNAVTTSVDGAFRFELVPVADYSIGKLERMTDLPSGIPEPAPFRYVPLKTEKNGTAPSVSVVSRGTTRLDHIEFQSSTAAFSQRPNADPFTKPTDERAAPANLPPG